MLILKKDNQRGVYVPLRALFLVVPEERRVHYDNTSIQYTVNPRFTI